MDIDVKLLEQFKKIDSNNNADDCFEIGKKLHEIDMLDKAEKAYVRAVILSPDNGKFYVELGILFQMQKKFLEAEGAYSKSIALGINSPFVWFNFGVLLFDMGKFIESLYCYRRSIELDSKNPSCCFYYGISLVEVEMFEEAELVFERSIELSPDKILHCMSCNMLGVVLLKLNKLNESEYFFKEAILLNKDYPSVYVNYANLLFKLRRSNEAMELLKKAYKLDPSIDIAIKK